MKKKAQGLSTNAIILIVLGVVVLVVLAIGFLAGWEKIAPWMSNDNVGTIAQQCEIACSTNSAYDYCSKERELKVDGAIVGKGNCSYFVTLESGKYGIKDCPGLC